MIVVGYGWWSGAVESDAGEVVCGEGAVGPAVMIGEIDRESVLSSSKAAMDGSVMLGLAGTRRLASTGLRHLPQAAAALLGLLVLIALPYEGVERLHGDDTVVMAAFARAGQR